MTTTVLKTYPSKTGYGSYEIRKDATLGLYCTCPGWKFSDDTPHLCKHIREYAGINAQAASIIRLASANQEKARQEAIVRHEEYKRRLHGDVEFARGHALAENSQHDILVEYEAALREDDEEGIAGCWRRVGDQTVGSIKLKLAKLHGKICMPACTIFSSDWPVVIKKMENLYRHDSWEYELGVGDTKLIDFREWLGHKCEKEKFKWEHDVAEGKTILCFEDWLDAEAAKVVRDWPEGNEAAKDVHSLGS